MVFSQRSVSPANRQSVFLVNLEIFTIRYLIYKSKPLALIFCWKFARDTAAEILRQYLFSSNSSQMHVIPSVLTSFLKVQIADVNILFLFYSFRINLRIVLLRKIIPVSQSATTRVAANCTDLLLLKSYHSQV